MSYTTEFEKQEQLTASFADTDTKGKNIPFLSGEIQEHFRTSRTPLLNTEDNRRTRRMDDKPQKQVQNNRKKTKGRVGLRVLNKMSYFHLKTSWMRDPRRLQTL